MASFRSSMLRFMIRKTVNWNKPLHELRLNLERLNQKAAIPPNVSVVSVSAGGVRADWLEPAGAPSDKVILYVHGGGFCLGVVNSNRSFVARIAAETGMKVVLADYRLAPENPYPAAVEDMVSVYRWLLDQGYLAEKIVFVADSSGCGLGLAALMTLREKQEPMPKALVLMSPVVDLKGTGASIETRKAVDPFQYADPLGLVKHYIGNNNPASPVISPLFGDLHGLPPMLIHAGDYDVFLSDSTRLAEQAGKAGIEAELKIWEKMWHIFHMSVGLLPEANVALEEISAYIKRKVG